MTNEFLLARMEKMSILLGIAMGSLSQLSHYDGISTDSKAALLNVIKLLEKGIEGLYYEKAYDK